MVFHHPSGYSDPATWALKLSDIREFIRNTRDTGNTPWGFDNVGRFEVLEETQYHHVIWRFP
jgi:hypothetical protein